MTGAGKVNMLVYLVSIGVFVLSLIVSTPGRAQVSGASLSGSVTDNSGGVIGQAQIEIRNVGTSVVTTAISNADGFYTVANLLPGTYEVSASKQGFKTQVRPSVTLEVGAHQVLDVALEVGEMTERVEVTAEVTTVDLASSSITGEVNATTVRELPLNGRSWTDLANLQPSVAPIETQQDMANNTANRGQRGFGDQISVSGGRPGMNNYRLDGISINNWDNAGPGSVLGGNLGVDAIQEFSVITTNYSAEYGKTAGGVINAISRSGTNGFHGSAYEFIRNSALDAPNFFDNGVTPPFRRNQFGASAGGPIQKDRTFFFVDYEGIRQAQGVSILNVVPSVAARGGNLCSVPSSSACSPNTVAVDPAAATYLKFYPLPNQGLVAGSNGDQAYNRFAQTQLAHENFFTGRIDRKFSEKDSLFGSYNYDQTPFTAPDSFNDVINLDQTHRQVYTIEETHTFSSSLVNTARVGYHRERSLAYIADGINNPLAADTTIGVAPGDTAAGVSINGGFTAFGGGEGAATGYQYIWNTFQGDDDAMLVLGTHSLKFGAAVERDQSSHDKVGGNSGKFTFASLTNFLTNKPKTFVGFPILPPTNDFRQTIFGAYLQDDWRFRHNLTLNLGIRYEMASDITEVHGYLAILPTINASIPRLGNPFFASNPALHDFEPRVGFAWDPFSNGKTAVRGGFGLFAVLPLIYQMNTPVSGNAPFAEKGTLTTLPQGSFPAGAQALLLPTSLTSMYTDPDPAESYVMQWNLNVQRQIAGGWTVSAGYIGTRGVHLPLKSDNVNQVVPYQTSVGYVFPIGGTISNPAWGEEHGQFYDGMSYYNALNLEVTKTLSHGLQVQTSFTWSKSIDTGSVVAQGDEFNNSIPTPPTYFDLSTMRGLSDFNVGRSLVVNWIWDLPTAKGLPGPAQWITNGWELGSIITLHDGIPFTPTFGKGNDVLGAKSTDPIDFPDRITGPGCKTAVNPGNVLDYINTSCFAIPTAPSAAFYAANCDPSKGTYPQCFNLVGNAGRNSLIGPGLFNVDFSVFKNNRIPRISETFNAQFRVEMFNVFNHPNFEVPLTAIGGADIFTSGGAPESAGTLLLSTSTPSREIQFGLKLIW